MTNIKTILTLAAAFMFAVASPSIAQTAASGVNINSDRTGFYVGANAGRAFQNVSDVTGGLQAGYQAHRNFRIEATYDHMWNSAARNSNIAMVNAIAQQRIPSTTVTPYILAGVGLEFNEFSTALRDGRYNGLYNVGAGVRVAISNRLELDTRYRYVAPVSSGASTVRASVVTAGVTYRF
jgi:opacity protein-like surface antigen